MENNTTEDETSGHKLNFLDKFNASQRICEHLIGPNHTVAHKLIAGFTICCIGVGITELPYFEIHLLHKFFDVTGYLIHGVGGIPFIKFIFKE